MESVDFEQIVSHLLAEGIDLKSLQHYLTRRISSSVNLEPAEDENSPYFRGLLQKFDQDGVDLKLFRDFLVQYQKSLSSGPNDKKKFESTVDISISADEANRGNTSIFMKSLQPEELDNLPSYDEVKEEAIKSSSRETSLHRKPLSQELADSSKELPSTVKLAPNKRGKLTSLTRQSEQNSEDPNCNFQLSQNPEENDFFKEICFQLLLHSKVQVSELNILINKLGDQELAPRNLFQLLLKENKIRMDECFEWEQGNLPQTPPGFTNPYRIRRNRHHKIEFYIEDSLCTKKFGNYRVIGELARGGMGIVYKAYHPSLDQYFALKVLIAGESASEGALRRFHREAQSTARLKHPGIVQVMDSGESGGEHYFAMEFVDGHTLGQLIRKRIPIREGLVILKKTLETLHHAHNLGIIHRDLKPDNIFVTPEGEPKVGDFGLAKDFSMDQKSAQLTNSGAIIGTPSYMSPEQAAGQTASLDERSDVYAIGVILYQMVTGKLPFEADSLHDLLYKVINEDPPAPSKFDPEISKDLETIILKSMEKQKTNRYRNAGEFALDLARYLDGYEIEAQGLSSSERIWRWVKRNKQIVISAALTFFVLISLLFFVFWKAQRESQQEFAKMKEEQERRKEQFQGVLSEVGKQEQILASFSDFQETQQEEALLQALHLLNKSLQILPKSMEAEKRKYDILCQLIDFYNHHQKFLKVEYYQKEAEMLSSIEPEKVQQLQERVFQIQEAQEAKQFQRMQWIEKSLLNGLTEESKDFIFELHQMRSEKAVQRQLSLLKEGTQYFLIQNFPQAKRVDFYGAVILALGYAKCPEAFQPIRESLKKMVSHYLEKALEERNSVFVHFIVVLARALYWYQNETAFRELLAVRTQMREEPVYLQKT